VRTREDAIDNANEYAPGDPAPVSGTYAEVNTFGTPTGLHAIAARGQPLPFAPRGWTWVLLKDHAAEW
jgi:hypothetical protein